MLEQEVIEPAGAEELTEEIAAPAEESTAPEVDYEQLAQRDVERLSEQFSELRDLKDISELENPLRYAALRDLGLSPEEAYLATTRKRARSDNRAHLYTSVPRTSSLPRGAISERELEAARDLFPGVSDADIRQLYKKVTK